MNFITTRDGTSLYYKSWGKGQPIVFCHGWPLNSDSWDAQMHFLAGHGYQCVAHDRRGHGRSSQPSTGNDMDTYECIRAFSETDFTADLARFDVPTLIIHGDDDQVVPIDASARAAARLVPQARLLVYPGAPHGLTETHQDRVNADLLQFLRET